MNDSAKNKALQFLQKHNGMVLSTLSPDNSLESAYVFFAVNEQLDLYILTSKSTQKCVNIQSNKEVVFVVTDEENLVTLQGKGEASEITDGPDSIAAFNAIMEVITKKVKNWPPPAGKIKDGGVVIIKIKPTRWRLRDYANSKDFVSDSAE